jgi:predicted DNA binding CopG/RHH family protein
MKGKYMSKNQNKLPRFLNDDDERDFWSKEDSTNYFDWTKAKETILPNLKPSLKTISLRLPESMIHSLKIIANKNDIPYQSLIKIIIQERLDRETYYPT